MVRHILHGRVVTVSLVLCLIVLHCAPDRAQNPTKGRLDILVGESIAPVIIKEVEAFLRLYGQQGAEIHYSVMSSDSAVRRFVLDTVAMIFTTQRLTPFEQGRVGSASGSLTEILVAYDGVAAVVSDRNPINELTFRDLGRILDGSVIRWSSVSKAGYAGGSIKVFLQDPSDVTSMLRLRFPKEFRFSSKLRRTQSELQTLQAVSNDASSLGLVGLSWIDSAKAHVRTVRISETAEDADTTFHPPPESFGKYYAPHPAHIYRSYYPLKRAMYMYIRSDRGDLSSGFGTFVSHSEGQRVFLEHGLVPATQPIRLKAPE